MKTKVGSNLFKPIVLHICNMQQLKLPAYSFKIKTIDGIDLIFDRVRSKYVTLTEEEWVRQHIICYLIEDLNYPKGLIKVESGVLYNTRTKRSDIVVYNNLGKPLILVECKSPTTNISQATLEQAAMYNHTLKAKIILLTNGLNHYTFSVGDKGKLINLESVPPYQRAKQ